MRAYTKLNLLARPDDLQAWRCWHGYGDYLMGSAAWLELEKFADAEGIDLAAALTRVAEGTAPNFPLRDKLAARHADGLGFIAANREAPLPSYARDRRRQSFESSSVSAWPATVRRALRDDERCGRRPGLPRRRRRLRETIIMRLCGPMRSRVNAGPNGLPARDAEVVSTDDARAAIRSTAAAPSTPAWPRRGDLLVLLRHGRPGTAERTRDEGRPCAQRGDNERVALVEPAASSSTTAALRPETPEQPAFGLPTAAINAPPDSLPVYAGDDGARDVVTPWCDTSRAPVVTKERSRGAPFSYMSQRDLTPLTHASSSSKVSASCWAKPRVRLPRPL